MTDKELLKEEYLSLQKSVGEFDAKALTIKTWSVTTSGAALAAAYLEHEKWVLLIAAGSSLVFWYIDALWKVNQRVYYPRIREIEAHFRGEIATTPLQVSAARVKENMRRSKSRRTWAVAREPVAFLPHVAVFVAGLVLFFAFPPRKDEVPAPSAAETKTSSEGMRTSPGR
jgi:hypothetical protein